MHLKWQFYEQSCLADQNKTQTQLQNAVSTYFGWADITLAANGSYVIKYDRYIQNGGRKPEVGLTKKRVNRPDDCMPFLIGTRPGFQNIVACYK